jgi:hypothetical protein
MCESATAYNLYALRTDYLKDIKALGHSEEQADQSIQVAYLQAARRLTTPRVRAIAVCASGLTLLTGVAAAFAANIMMPDTIAGSPLLADSAKTMATVGLFSGGFLGSSYALRKINERMFVRPFFERQFDDCGRVNPLAQGDELAYAGAQRILSGRYGVAWKKPTIQPNP